jgi:hypothetical protein
MNCHMLCTMLPIWISGKGRMSRFYTPGLPILDITKRSVKTMKIHFTVAELYKKPKGNPVFNIPPQVSSFPFIFSWHFFPSLHYTFADPPSWKFSGQTWWKGREGAWCLDNGSPWQAIDSLAEGRMGLWRGPVIPIAEIRRTICQMFEKSFAA